MHLFTSALSQSCKDKREVNITVKIESCSLKQDEWNTKKHCVWNTRIPAYLTGFIRELICLNTKWLEEIGQSGVYKTS